MSPPPTGAAAGWFPDPDGTPGRFRYWDGARWTAQTSATRPPAGTRPPGQALGPPAQSGDPRSRRRATLGVIAVVVVLALIAGIWAVTRAVGRDDNDITDDPPVSTVSPGDDGATPTATPSPSASPSQPATRSPTPVQPDPSGERPENCDETRPDELPLPPDDGRVHGGPLSYPTAALPGWSGPASEPRIPYGRDAWMLYQVVTTETRGWQSSAVVGVTAFEDFPGTEIAANTMLQCVVTSSLYLDLDVKISSVDTTSITVDQVPAARLDAVISFDDPSLKTKGSRVWIVVVDTEPATFLFAATPKESAAEISLVDTVISKLTVD